MFKNYIVSALRNFWKNKLFAFINIGGLAIGLTVFVFANLYANYESTHDVFFENSERIYTVKTDVNPAAKLGAVSINTIFTAVAPFMRQDIPEIEKVARLSWTDLIINRDEVKFYQPVHMVEPEFLDIFKFDYIQGQAEGALADNNSTVLTESTALKYFGRTNVLGETLTLNNERDMRVTAVIKDLPLNSHLSGNMLDEEHMEMLVNLNIFLDVFDVEAIENWGNLSISQRTYALLPVGVSPESLEGRLDAIIDRYGPDDAREMVASIGFRPLKDMNLLIWSAIGIPGILIMRFLGLVVLGIASINFINLATAQALGRAREIGIRKTMGASRARLAVQFLVEAVVVSFIALLIAVAVIEYALPAFNTALNKAITFSYLANLSMAAFLVLTVIGVGLFSGSFPALLLARLDASKALQGAMALGKWSVRFRKVLVVSQNTFSVFLVIIVLISYSLTDSITNQDLGFNADNTITLLRTNREGVNENFETLKNEISRVPGVLSVAGTSQYPYEQSNSSGKYTLTPGDVASANTIQIIRVDYNFNELLEIPLLAGRQLSEKFSNDAIPRGSNQDEGGTVNVIINALAAKQLGWTNPADAIGETFFGISGNGSGYTYVIAGVSENAHFQGFHNEQKPFIFFVRPESFSTIMIKYDPALQVQATAGIEATWDRIVPEFPIIRSSLDEAFADVFAIFSGITKALIGFSVMAVLIATVGLFGLSAFMAERRIREVGIRKTFGASTGKVVKLLTFQFSRPVLWAILFGWILAGLATVGMTQNFANTPELSLIIMVFLFGGLFSLVLAWITVGANAYRAANTNPANSLHYE